MITVLILLLTAPVLHCSMTDVLRSHDFRVAATQVSGYLKITANGDGNYTFSGFSKDYLDVLFDKSAGLRYHLVAIDPKITAARGFSAAIDVISSGEMDMSSVGFLPTPERLRIVDFTKWVLVEQYAFLVPYPEEKSRIWGPIRPFQPTVWLLLFTSSCATIIALSRVSANETSFRQQMSDNTVFIITTLISNAEYYRGGAFRLRILLAAWCLMCLVIVNSYTGNLTSYLTFPALQPIPNSFEELANSNEYNLIIEYKSVMAEEILEATSGSFKVLGDSLRNHPNHLTRTTADNAKLRNTTKIAYPGMIYINYFLMEQHVKDSGKCEYTISKPIPRFLKNPLVFQKNSPYLEAVNERIQRLDEMALVKHLRNKHLPKVEKCLLEKRTQPKLKPITLYALVSAFTLYGCGVAISVAVFIIEIIYGIRS